MEESRRKRGESVGGSAPEGSATGEESEISLRSTAGRPWFVRVAEGDLLWEGDREPVQTLRAWEVERVGGRRVDVVERRTGDRQTLDRRWVERQLATGAMSTNLGGVEWVRLREWPHPDGGTYLTALAHGDNGRTYLRRYRPVDDAGRVVELWTDDPAARWLTDAGRATLDHGVTTAIATTGATLREAR
ncbi:hypothetical protein [Halomarina litorea]|uniref:hypothetical protein n=1 Tax=Halomarina litorea TaxID=2961595 RepID=UPI0020C36AEF|nr:hypothetical protein [Halomarina sp. BCD28]